MRINRVCGQGARTRFVAWPERSVGAGGSADLHFALGNEFPPRHVRPLSWEHAGDRASGSEWLPPGTHAGGVPPGCITRSRLSGAGPGRHPRRRPGLPARERDLRYDGRRGPPGVRGPEDHQGRRRDRRHRLVRRSEEHTSELQSRPHLVCRLLLEKKQKKLLRLFYKKNKKKKKQK